MDMTTRIPLCVLAALVGVACQNSSPGPAAPEPSPTPDVAEPSPEKPSPAASSEPVEEGATATAHTAEKITCDGFRLGDSYQEKVMSRDPYREPCDNDPIDHDARRFMVYGGKPCRDRSFPEATTVMFYLAFSDDARYAQPIEAFAWMGGGYFSSRCDLPVKVGDPESRVVEVLGPPQATFKLERKRSSLTVLAHAGNIYSLVNQGQAVGFVLGPMPKEADNEQWRGLMQMYDRYTKKPGE